MNLSKVWGENIAENTVYVRNKSYYYYCKAWKTAYTLDCLQDFIETEEEWARYDKIEDDTFLQIHLIERIINPPQAVKNEIKDIARREASSGSSLADRLLRRIKKEAVA